MTILQVVCLLLKLFTITRFWLTDDTAHLQLT
jgi:hypothetical protein